MSQLIDLGSIAIIYDGDYVSCVPNTYKAFLELLRDKAGLTNQEFQDKTVWRGDFPITCKKDFIRAIRKCKDDGIMQIDLVSNELDAKEGITEKDYLQFLELKEPEEEIKINIEEEENKEETIYIESKVNEFYAVTQITQYYKNNNNKPIELSITYPLRKEINFKKFTININGKKSVSRIFDKEKTNEKYSDAIASGNVGIFSKYTENETNSYSITIGNVAPDAIVELTSEFIQFITSDDMSLCFHVMTKYPTFSDSISRNYLKNISGKISLKTHSKITRLVNKNFNIDKYFKRTFNEDNTSCDIEFKILNDSKNYNSILSLIFRTEKMNEPYLVSQYNPEKDETSYIFGMIYDQKPISLPEEPDTDININYYQKYQTGQKTDTPSLFIFLIDQSGSMSGSPMRLVSESLLFFLQSLPKGSYFQLIGFGSSFKKINNEPLIYNKENVKFTMDIIKNLKADLGGTDISSPLNEIFNIKDYDNINLGRNLFILTDGEVDNREECLELIAMNSDKFKVHAIGIGSSFDKQLIQNAGILGNGSYHFVTNVSNVNSVIIQSLSKCLRNYLLNVKLSLDKITPAYEYLTKNNFFYPDEILNYYFIIKGKNNNENIQINFESESPKKKENLIFSNEAIIKEDDGEIIGQIIIGNILKNSENTLDENLEIKLSKNYQILSNKTCLFAVVEGDESFKIGELKQVKKKEIVKNNLFGSFNNQNNYNMNYLNNNNLNINNYKNSNNLLFSQPYQGLQMNNNSNNYNQIYSKQRRECLYNMNNFENSNPYRSYQNTSNFDYNPYMEMEKELESKKCKKKMKMEKELDKKCEEKKMKMEIESEDEKEEKKCKKKRKCLKRKCKKSLEEDNDYMEGEGGMSDEPKIEEARYEMPLKLNKIEKVEFSNKELIITQDIFDGYWNLNPQTNILIEKNKTVYEKIEKIMKEKNLDQEEIKVTLLVLYYLNTDTSINKVEYSLIIQKANDFLKKNNINFEEILSTIKS